MAVSLLLMLPFLAGCFRESQEPPPKNGTDGPTTPQFIEPSFASSGEKFASPLRIDLTASGWLLVSDPKRKAVYRVDPESLKADRSLRIEGTPLAVGMLGGKIYVGVEEAKSIEIYSYKGVQQGFLAEPGTIEHPGDLAIDEETGVVLALDGIAREVKMFGIASRSLTGTIGSGQLDAPSGVAVDPSRQEVLVSDYGSSVVKASVKIFSYAPGTFGNLLATMTAGSCNFMGCSGGFSRPRGLAVFNSRIFLPDALLGQVLIFDRGTLQKVGELGSADPATRDLRVPSDIEISAEGDVYVTSTLSGSVVVFRGGAL